jgi:hypothetical protein
MFTHTHNALSFTVGDRVDLKRHKSHKMTPQSLAILQYANANENLQLTEKRAKYNSHNFMKLINNKIAFILPLSTETFSTAKQLFCRSPAQCCSFNYESF